MVAGGVVFVGCVMGCWYDLGVCSCLCLRSWLVGFWLLVCCCFCCCVLLFGFGCDGGLFWVVFVGLFYWWWVGFLLF